jgi:hypothetical protein
MKFVKFVSIFILTACVMHAATTWYLDKSAPGPTFDGSLLHPWNNMSQITGEVTGDTLIVNGGDYSKDGSGATIGELGIISGARTNFTIKINPLATQQAVFKAINIYKGHNCLIDGLKPGGYTTGKYSKTIQWFRTNGTALTNGNGSSLNMRESHNLIIRGVEVDQSGIIYGISDFGSNHHGIGLNGDVVQNTIEYCFIHDTICDGVNGIYNTAANTFHTHTNFDTIIVRYSVITRFHDDCIQAGSNISVYNNYCDQEALPVFYGGHPDAVQCSKGCSYIKIYNNIFANVGQMPFIENGDGENYCYQNIIIRTGVPNAGDSPPGGSKGVQISSWGGVVSSATGISFVGTKAHLTANPQRMLTGQTVTVTGATGPDASLYNGTFAVTNYSSNLFLEYTMSGTPTGNATGTILYGENYFGNAVIANNVCYALNQNAPSLSSITPTVDTLGVSYDGNVLISCSSAAVSATPSTSFYWDLPGVIWYNSNGAVIGSPIRINGSATNADPLLVDEGTTGFSTFTKFTFDFHPTMSSPLIGASANLTAYGITTDFDGNPRPAVGNWTSGIYEGAGTGTVSIPLPIFCSQPVLIC